MAGTFTFGPSPARVYVVDHASASRRHADIFLVAVAIKVRDLGSSNGTFLDGLRINEFVITLGPSGRFGAKSFRFFKLGS